jgi:uncharacterized membrane protein YeaQ/YmgE (transglycosylase-associated protein family)
VQHVEEHRAAELSKRIDEPRGQHSPHFLGILGGVLGGWVFGLLGVWQGRGMFGSIVVAFVGAVILVWITRLLKRA